MDFSTFAFWLLTGLLGIFATSMIKSFNNLLSEIKAMRMEMSSLNEKLAHVVTNQDWHGKELTRLDNRLNILENSHKRE